MRHALIVLLIAVASSNAASRQTTNFIVQANLQTDADEFAQLAEKYRKEVAIAWLGKVMPDWEVPCRLTVYIKSGGPSGMTSFQYGTTIYQEMQIEGERTKLKDNVLPHEITHTVFAHFFRKASPRWADEGGAVFSEKDTDSFVKLNRTILNDGRGIKLSTLFKLEEYPKDVMCLYAQGYSVTNYLISLKDRKTYLNFISTGMSKGWDTACKEHYNISTVDDLEQVWINHLRLPFKH
jgi:hypothetical protein